MQIVPLLCINNYLWSPITMQTPSLFIKLYLSVKTLYSQAESTLKFALKRLSTFFSFPKAQVFEKSFKNPYHNS